MGSIRICYFKRTYARRLNEFDPEATGTEEWWQTCRRVIEGMFNMQKQHVFLLGLSGTTTRRNERLKMHTIACLILKWTPPGRGWMMGTKFVEERTAAGYLIAPFVHWRSCNKGGYLFAVDDGRFDGWYWRWL